MILAALFACTVIAIPDGDTWRCKETTPNGKQIRIRGHGFNAREIHGNYCRPNAPCPKASAEAARQALSSLIRGKTLHCTRMGRSWERIDAMCRTPDGLDVSCQMLRGGTVAYWPAYDKQGRLRRCLP